MPVSRVLGACIAVLLLACTGTQHRPSWRPEPGEDLRRSCAAAPAECRKSAEAVASRWEQAEKEERNDEDPFQALRLYAAACQLGDLPACAALDSRFEAPRNWGEKFEALPVPVPANAPAPAPGPWAATCQFLSSGSPTACRVDQSLPAVDDMILERVRTGSWSPATLDGHAFRCWYRIEASVRPVKN